MPIYSGNNQVRRIYYGNRRIGRVYYGSTLRFGYTPSTVLFSSSTPQDTTLTLQYAGNFRIVVVGGGGGGSNSEGGSGAYFECNVNLEAGTYNLTIGGGGAGAAAYCRNHNGESGGESSFTGSGISIVCQGGRYGCGRRNECGSGSSYAPTYSISRSYTRIGASTEEIRRESWYGTYGQGGTGGCEEYGSVAGDAGYIRVETLL